MLHLAVRLRPTPPICDSGIRLVRFIARGEPPLDGGFAVTASAEAVVSSIGQLRPNRTVSCELPDAQTPAPRTQIPVATSDTPSVRARSLDAALESARNDRYTTTASAEAVGSSIG